MISRQLMLGVLCAGVAIMSSEFTVASASPNKGTRIAYTGRRPVLLAKKMVVPLGAMTKGHRAQDHIELPALSPSELDYIHQKENEDGQKRLRIGIGRPFAQSVSIDAQSAPTGKWTVGTNGTHIWTVHLTSHGALGLRVHLEGLSLDPRITVVTYNPNSPDATIAPVPCEKPDPQVGVWTPTVFGEDAVVECQAPANVDVSTVRLKVTGVSHQYRIAAVPKAASSPCEHDITCHPDWMDSASGVAHIEFMDAQGDGFACSGCLIADRNPYGSGNYFLTAHHCISSAGLASTIESIWFWYDTVCDNSSTDNGGGIVVGGGADLLATSSSSDFALVRLIDDPPDGATPQDWSTNSLGANEAVVGIHYPWLVTDTDASPETEKISFGHEIYQDGDFWHPQWNSNFNQDNGVTEEGSSGSPLFNSQHQIVGQLWGGSSACDNLEGIDKYGRFDKTYASIRQWIDSFPFAQVQGSYSGLFSDSGNPSNQNSGFFSLMLRSGGTYTGKLKLAGKSYSISGAFDQTGFASNQIAANGAGLNVQMSLDVTPGAESIGGTIGTSTLLAKRAAFDSRTNSASFAPSYTVVLPGGSSSDVPGGNGFASITIDSGGHAKISGTSGDGISFSESAVVFPDNTLPFFANLYGGKGVIDGWLNFSGGSPPDSISGSLLWLKDGGQKTKFYQDGFTVPIDAFGEVYQRPSSGMPIIANSTGTVSFSNGNLASDFENDIAISANNKISDNSANKLTMTFSTSTGRFNGSVTPPSGKRAIPYHGIILQQSATGYGYFLGTNESGSVQLSTP